MVETGRLTRCDPFALNVFGYNLDPGAEFDTDQVVFSGEHAEPFARSWLRVYGREQPDEAGGPV